MSDVFRIIKKYPNRRLYDTELSSYVTLDDIRQLVLSYRPFKVLDNKSGEDITRSILMQIISEQESKDGSPIFSNQTLEHVIRFYGDSLQGVMSEYLEKSIAVFMEQQEGLRHQLNNVMNAAPIKTLSDIANKPIALIKKIKHDWHARQSKQQNARKLKLNQVICRRNVYLAQIIMFSRAIFPNLANPYNFLYQQIVIILGI